MLQDAPSGAPLQKSLSSFTPLESALHHPWEKLSARFTHKLVYALKGECDLHWCHIMKVNVVPQDLRLRSRCTKVLPWNIVRK